MEEQLTPSPSPSGVSVMIRDVTVEFPFKPYDCQITYMERVIQSLQESKHALLESPTGTGKTLSLLCAALAWRAKWVEDHQAELNARQEFDGRNDYSGEAHTMIAYDDNSGNVIPRQSAPRIIYASRTHSQLTQVVKELKSTAYRPKTSILGSRKQMCVHPEVSLSKGVVLDHKCRNTVTTGGCSYYNNVKEYRNMPEMERFIADIEDLVDWSREHEVCPYYLSREQQHTAHITLTPYNYLVDPKIRRSLSLDLDGAVLIFDEAHNLESVCEDAASFDITVNDLRDCIKELDKCIQMAGKPNYKGECQAEEFAKLKGLFNTLISAVMAVRVGAEGVSKPGDYIYELLGTANVNHDTAEPTTHLIDMAIADLVGDEEDNFTRKALSLKVFNDCLKLLFKDRAESQAEFSRYYKCHIHDEKGRPAARGVIKASNVQTDRTLSCWCFNPGLTMNDLLRQGVRNVILTSGTLSPLDSFAAELKIPFPIQLENKHVIDANQIWVGVICKGPSNHALNSSFKTRENIEYKSGLGNALVNFSRIVPDGLLVFFPSYSLLSTCIDAWKQPLAGNITAPTIWDRICQNKQPILEPREAFQFSMAMEDFYRKVQDPDLSGAAFFAVCRGKVSEGLDFADQNGRACVITGLPFPALTDAKVKLKRAFLDEEKKRTPTALGGSDWYTQQSSRAVNQAIGRVIRHRYDYGAIILCDERFAFPANIKGLPAWLRPYCKIYNTFGDVALSLTRFFNNVKNIVPPPQKKRQYPKEEDDHTYGGHNNSTMTLTMGVRRPPLTKPKPVSPEKNAATTSTTTTTSKPFASPRKANEPNTKATTTTATTTTATTPKKHSSHSDQKKAFAQNYIRRVKKTLRATEYKQFQSLLKQYKSKQIHIDVLIAEIHSLFSTSERYSLLQDFITFIPAKHQDKYKSEIEKYRPTTTTTTTTPTTTTTTTRLPPIKVEKASMEMDDENEEEEARVASSPSNVPPLDSSPWPEIGTPNKRQRQEALASADKDGGIKVGKLGYDLISGQRTPSKKKRRLNPEFMGRTSVTLAPTTTTTTTTTTTSQPSPAGAPSSSPPSSAPATAPAPSEGAVAQADDNNSEQKGVLCPVCRDKVQSPWAAKCGHVCCYSCWQRWLESKLECPVCRERVRSTKKLVKLYFY